MPGFLVMKSLILFTKTNMTIIDTTMATTMMISSCTIPTAVRMESMENTKSTNRIIPITPAKLEGLRFTVSSRSGMSTLWCISLIVFTKRKIPPASRIKSLPENSGSIKSFRTSGIGIVTKGSVKCTNHEIPMSRMIRKISASANPIFLALGRWSSGSFSDTIEIKRILSMPKMISNTTSVARAMILSHWVSASNPHSISVLITHFHHGQDGGDGNGFARFVIHVHQKFHDSLRHVVFASLFLSNFLFDRELHPDGHSRIHRLGESTVFQTVIQQNGSFFGIDEQPRGLTQHEITVGHALFENGAV